MQYVFLPNERKYPFWWNCSSRISMVGKRKLNTNPTAHRTTGLKGNKAVICILNFPDSALHETYGTGFLKEMCSSCMLHFILATLSLSLFLATQSFQIKIFSFSGWQATPKSLGFWSKILSSVKPPLWLSPRLAHTLWECVPVHLAAPSLLRNPLREEMSL